MLFYNFCRKILIIIRISLSNKNKFVTLHFVKFAGFLLLDFICEVEL